MSSARFRCTTTIIRKIAEIANLNSLFLVKRKTRQKNGSIRTRQFTSVKPVETGFTTYKTV